jgi:aspartate-semialdehyde dehydrogenase
LSGKKLDSARPQHKHHISYSFSLSFPFFFFLFSFFFFLFSFFFIPQAQVGLFSAGGSISEKYAPIAAEAGCIVIDNTAHINY